MSLLPVLSLLACSRSPDAPMAAEGGSAAARVETAWSSDAGGRAVGEVLGYAVANAGDVNADGYDDVVVGAPANNLNVQGGGAVRVLLGGSSPMVEFATVYGEYAYDQLGMSVAGVGDLNGDGYADVAVGAPLWLNGTGRVDIVYGGPVPAYAAPIQGSAQGDYFGWSVGGAGNPDHDCCDELVVGAPQYGTGNFGYAQVYPGTSSGVSSFASQTFPGSGSDGGMGSAVAAGDFDGDGNTDLAIGQPNLGFGSVQLLRWQGNSVYTLSANLVDNAQPTFGAALASGGDVDGGGYDDLLVGSPNANTMVSGGGRVQLFLGGASGVSSAPAFVHDGDQFNEQLGYSVSMVGDLEGDGRADVAVGSYQHQSGAGQAGAVFVLSGEPGGLGAGNPVQLVGPGNSGEMFGFAVSGGGDYDNDGHSDVIVGCPNDRSGDGAVYIFRGFAQDDDGDGLTVDLDCDDQNYFVGMGPLFNVDSDGDGFGDPTMSLYSCSQGPGLVLNSSDCDDTSPFIYPGQIEICDNVDQDCDNVVDDGLFTSVYYFDGDTDGYGDDATAVEQCGPFGLVGAGGDCDDSRSGVNPGATEIVENGLDDDCDPATIDGDGDVDNDGISDADENTLGLDPLLADSDGDGRSDPDEVGSVANPDDSDGDGVIDALDEDDDGDAIPSLLEGWDDADGDGVPNALDLDSDDDLSADEAEGSGDVDEDGVPNFLDDGSVTREEPPPVPPLCGTATAPSWLGFAAAALLFRRRRSA